MASSLNLGHKNHIPYKLRSWSDDGHIAFEDVQELWELIKGRRTKKFAVLVETLLIGQKVTSGVLTVRHSAKFDQLEDFFLAVFALFAGARLNEEGITSHGDCSDDSKE